MIFLKSSSAQPASLAHQLFHLLRQHGQSLRADVWNIKKLVGGWYIYPSDGNSGFIDLKRVVYKWFIVDDNG
jgi:hypothetical protein